MFLSLSRRAAGPSARSRPWRFVLRRRRLLAALLCCAAAGIAVEALLPPAAGEATLLVAAADLSAGTVLADRDLKTITVPAAAVPPDSFTAAADIRGRRLATPLMRGSPLMQTSLVGAGLLTGAPPGTVAVSVRPADPAMLQLLRPGQLVDVVLGSPDGLAADGLAADGLAADGPTVLAAGAPVLWTAEDGAAAWPDAQETGDVVVLAAAPAEAAALAAASGAGRVHLILTGG